MIVTPVSRLSDKAQMDPRQLQPGDGQRGRAYTSPRGRPGCITTTPYGRAGDITPAGISPVARAKPPLPAGDSLPAASPPKARGPMVPSPYGYPGDHIVPSISPSKLQGLQGQGHVPGVSGGSAGPMAMPGAGKVPLAMPGHTSSGHAGYGGPEAYVGLHPAVADPYVHPGVASDPYGRTAVGEAAYGHPGAALHPAAPEYYGHPAYGRVQYSRSVLAGPAPAGLGPTTVMPTYPGHGIMPGARPAMGPGGVTAAMPLGPGLYGRPVGSGSPYGPAMSAAAGPAYAVAPRGVPVSQGVPTMPGHVPAHVSGYVPGHVLPGGPGVSFSGVPGVPMPGAVPPSVSYPSYGGYEALIPTYGYRPEAYVRPSPEGYSWPDGCDRPMSAHVPEAYRPIHMPMQMPVLAPSPSTVMPPAEMMAAGGPVPAYPAAWQPALAGPGEVQAVMPPHALVAGPGGMPVPVPVSGLHGRGLVSVPGMGHVPVPGRGLMAVDAMAKGLMYHPLAAAIPGALQGAAGLPSSGHVAVPGTAPVYPGPMLAMPAYPPPQMVLGQPPRSAGTWPAPEDSAMAAAAGGYYAPAVPVPVYVPLPLPNDTLALAVGLSHADSVVSASSSSTSTVVTSPAQVEPRRGFSGTLPPDEHGAENYPIIVAAIKSGADHRTSVMIRNIPNRYTPAMLMTELDGIGALDHYDFFYMPMDNDSGRNFGFAFVNFKHPSWVVTLYKAWHGAPWPHFNSRKTCHLSYARIQGVQPQTNQIKLKNMPVLQAGMLGGPPVVAAGLPVGLSSGKIVASEAPAGYAASAAGGPPGLSAAPSAADPDWLVTYTAAMSLGPPSSSAGPEHGRKRPMPGPGAAAAAGHGAMSHGATLAATSMEDAGPTPASADAPADPTVPAAAGLSDIQ